ncbi:MAG: hypothetical protein ACYDGY_02800 [Acidimicrobiales bacterium]
MSRVIQIRNVPDEVHDTLVDAARARQVSLTKYMLDEIESIAKRAQIVQHNASVIRTTQAEVRGRLDRDVILDVLHAGRHD